MSADAVVQWVLFGALGLVAIFMAAGMLLTMSMYRAGLALMASFLALAGLFLLLDGDLPFAIQIMMNVGGMLVMILFMVMLMMDPGGEDMTAMKRDMHMAGPGALAMHMPFGPPPPPPESERQGASDHMMHQTHADSGDASQPQAQDASEEDHGAMGSMDPTSGMESTDDMQGMQGMQGMGGMGDMGGMSPRGHYQMMVDMAMTTRQLPVALVLGALVAALLTMLVTLTAWPLSSASPKADASFQVGYLLLSRYMVGFEGAAFLIVGGIVGAIVLGRREGHAPGMASAGAGGGTEQAHSMTSTQPEHNEPHGHPSAGDAGG